MISAQTLTINNTKYDCSNAVSYHYGGFPPSSIDMGALFAPFAAALQQLTRYDEKIQNLFNSELLLAPLRRRDAVVSSRMEGTISTLDAVLRLEASQAASRDDNASSESVEVLLYARALRQAEQQMAEGYRLSEHLIRNAHRVLLSFGRGKEQSPGAYKTTQNYVGERRTKTVSFIPISPDRLSDGMGALIGFVRNSPHHPLITAAVAHAEFEALHPFEDGNGRLGRMLIPLMLWEQGVLSAPHFFVSDYFDRNKNEYIERLRNVSAEAAWDAWCGFFLTALAEQAQTNIDVVAKIQALYLSMKDRFRETLRSQYYTAALDYVFANPYFWNSHFVESAAAPSSTVQNFTRRLVAEGLLRVVVPPAGRAPGLYAFPALLEIISDDG